MRHFLTALLLAALTATPALSEELIGKAKIVDGDTLEIVDQRVHLRGVDAPEREQECTSRKGKVYKCGLQSIRYLFGMLRNQTLTCTGEARSADGGLIASCKIRWLDVNAQIVLDGWAFSDAPNGDLYRREEDAARSRREGLWRGGEVEEPWLWRQKHGGGSQ